MERVKHLFVWLSRITHCRGFGIQSPTDYWLTRYVINEHWPYYQYATLGRDDDWLHRKLGLLFFRLANWRQPRLVISDDWHDYLLSGCSHVRLMAWNEVNQQSPDMIIVKMEAVTREWLDAIYKKVDDRTVLIVEGIRRNKSVWRELIADERAVVTFDLYYCGIVFFDRKRTNQNYIINF